jgi:hypothetical protein
LTTLLLLVASHRAKAQEDISRGLVELRRTQLEEMVHHPVRSTLPLCA